MGNFRKLFSFISVLSLILCVFCASCFAEETVDSAQEAALRELEVLKSMGILSDNIRLDGDADYLVEDDEYVGDEYWFGRAFPRSFKVQWYYDTESSETNYGGYLFVNTDTGKLSFFNINVFPGEDVEPIGEKEIDGRTFYYYDNFEDIFPADMTVDKFCTLLAEYWGFSGYTISDTNDEIYGHFEAVSGESLLKDMPDDNYYLTVFFDGDQEGVPMYVQIMKCLGSIAMFVGTGHAVG